MKQIGAQVEGMRGEGCTSVSQLGKGTKGYARHWRGRAGTIGTLSKLEKYCTCNPQRSVESCRNSH
jgi:hypothetical protein